MTTNTVSVNLDDFPDVPEGMEILRDDFLWERSEWDGHICHYRLLMDGENQYVLQSTPGRIYPCPSQEWGRATERSETPTRFPRFIARLWNSFAFQRFGEDRLRLFLEVEPYPGDHFTPEKCQRFWNEAAWYYGMEQVQPEPLPVTLLGCAVEVQRKPPTAPYPPYGG